MNRETIVKWVVVLIIFFLFVMLMAHSAELWYEPYEPPTVPVPETTTPDSP